MLTPTGKRKTIFNNQDFCKPSHAAIQAAVLANSLPQQGRKYSHSGQRPLKPPPLAFGELCSKWSGAKATAKRPIPFAMPLGRLTRRCDRVHLTRNRSQQPPHTIVV